MRGTSYVKLINTSVFRLSIKISTCFAFLTIAVLLYVYYVTQHEIDGQVDNQLYSELHAMETYYNQRGLDDLVAMITERDYFGHPLRHYYTLIDEEKKFVGGSQFLAKKQQFGFYEKYDVLYSEMREHVTNDGKKVNIRLGQKTIGSGLQIIAAVAQNELTKLYENTLQTLITSIVVTVILALFLGYYFGSSVLKRVQIIDRGLQTAIDSNFNYQLEVSENADEFQALTSKLNFTLNRVVELITGMREITDNIAHDMRSPLTRIRSRIEVTLLQKRDEHEYIGALKKTNEDCDYLINTFNELLAIARTESGVAREAIETVDVVKIADEIAELYEAMAEEKNIQFHWEKPENIYLQCQPQLLGQAISNLLENAVKYTQEGGAVELKVGYIDHRPRIVVTDTGPGIPEKDRQRVLQRFQRLDQSRTLSGNGLGLSMVNAIAKMCKADLILGDNKPGLTVELRFPQCDKN